jgi:hypothetical protein
MPDRIHVNTFLAATSSHSLQSYHDLGHRPKWGAKTTEIARSFALHFQINQPRACFLGYCYFLISSGHYLGNLFRNLLKPSVLCANRNVENEMEGLVKRSIISHGLRPRVHWPVQIVSNILPNCCMTSFLPYLLNISSVD